MTAVIDNEDFKKFQEQKQIQKIEKKQQFFKNLRQKSDQDFLIDLNQLKWSDFEIYPGAAQKIHNYLLKILNKCNESDCAKDKTGITMNPYFIDSANTLKDIASGCNGKVILIEKNNLSLIIKQSLSIDDDDFDDLLVEFQNGTCINNLRPYLNHFIFTYGLINSVNSDDETKNLSLILENVDNIGTFNDYIESEEKIDSTLFYSLIFQVMMSLQIAQDKFKFVHVDLHTLNVLLEKIECCDVLQNEIVLYNYLYNNQEFEIPVQYNCKIIDLGRARMDEACVKKNNYLSLEIKKPFVYPNKNDETKDYELVFAHNIESMIRNKNKDKKDFEIRGMYRVPDFQLDMKVFLTFIYRNFQDSKLINSDLKRDFYNIFMLLISFKTPFEIANHIYKTKIQGKFSSSSTTKKFHWNYENKRSFEKIKNVCKAITMNGNQCMLLAQKQVTKKSRTCENGATGKNLVYIHYNRKTYCFELQELLTSKLQILKSVPNLPKILIEKSMNSLTPFVSTDYEIEEDEENNNYLVPARQFECNQYCTKHFSKWGEGLIKNIIANKISCAVVAPNNKVRPFKVENNKLLDLFTDKFYNEKEFVEYINETKPKKLVYGNTFYDFVF